MVVTHKGFAGLLLLAILIAGFLTLMYAQAGRSITEAYSDIYAKEISANHISAAREAIIKSWQMTAPENRFEMLIHAQALAGRYGLVLACDTTSAPTSCFLYDPATGLKSQFLLS
jgi:hypothetical protein